MVGPHYDTINRIVYIFFEFLTFLEAEMRTKRSFRSNLSVSIVSMMNELYEIENLNIHQLGGLVSKKENYRTSCIAQCTELSQFPDLFILTKA